jgi:transcriptional regulator with XRE-family HTH domain
MPSDTTAHPENVRVGATIRALREAHELTVTELARALGVSHTLISLIESGQKRATMANCREIARIFRVPLAAITVEGYERIADQQPASATS